MGGTLFTGSKVQLEPSAQFSTSFEAQLDLGAPIIDFKAPLYLGQVFSSHSVEIRQFSLPIGQGLGQASPNWECAW